MSRKSGKNKKRKPYRKPQLSQVELMAEEAVLGACKADDSNVKTKSSGAFCDLTGAGQCYSWGT